MKTKRHLILYCLLAALPLHAQPAGNERDNLLSEIEKNNTTLAALRQKAVAEKQGNKVGNALPDPKIGFSQSWANKQTYSVEQELDWGTLSGLRKKVTSKSDEIAELNYQLERQALLSEADQLIVLLIYQNALCEEMGYREERANTLRQLYEKKFKTGDANQLEVNKVRLNHTATIANLMNVRAQRDNTLGELKRLNGNRPIQCTTARYGQTQLPPLADLMERAESISPQLALARTHIQREQQQLQLSKSEAMPSLSLGYEGEFSKIERTNSLNIGMSIPVWSNTRNKVRQQRASLTLAEMEQADTELQIRSDLDRRYNVACQLLEIAAKFRKELTANEDISILDKSLEAGQISLIEYLNEVDFYYDAHTQVLEAERDSELAVSELWSIFR